jgi:hypothetical protein
MIICGWRRQVLKATAIATTLALVHDRRPRDLRRRFVSTGISPNSCRALSRAASPHFLEQYRNACWPSGSSQRRQVDRSVEAVRDRHNQVTSDAGLSSRRAARPFNFDFIDLPR